MLRKICLLLALLLFSGCSDSRPFLRKNVAGTTVQLSERSQRPDHDEVLTFYALGDWGTGEDGQRAVAAALKKDVAKIPAGRKVAPFVLELGDNVYENGLPAGWNNPEAVRLLEQTFGNVYSDVKYQGDNLTFHVIPGNHDYADNAGSGEGFGDVIHQETTAEKRFSFWKYYPIDPAKNSDTDDETNYRALKEDDIFELTIPEKLSVNAGRKISIIAIDTQVLLQLYQKNDAENLSKHLAELEALLEDNANWKFIIGHHPIRSHGKHGGFRTAVWWVPPIILATIVDKLFVKPLKDLDSAANRRFQKDLIRIMRTHNVLFYLAGHEHSLQFLQIDNRAFQIVSGSAAKRSPVTHKSDTIFSQSAHGLVRFDLTDKELWIEFLEVEVKSQQTSTTAVFRITK